MALGVTVMSAVVAPVFQEYVVPPLAVSVAEAPMQIVPSFGVPEVSVTVIVAVGRGLTVMDGHLIFGLSAYKSDLCHTTKLFSKPASVSILGAIKS